VFFITSGLLQIISCKSIGLTTALVMPDPSDAKISHKHATVEGETKGETKDETMAEEPPSLL